MQILPQTNSVPEYIIKVTKHIWEERNLNSLNHHYAKDIAVRSPAGIVVGNDSVIASTAGTLAEFPDRTLLGEDVIWHEQPNGQYLSSHRLFSTATHANDGMYGEASQRKLRYRIIADCAGKNDIIDDEWIIRDQAAIVKQIGTTAKAYAIAQIEAEGATPNHPYDPQVFDIRGPYNAAGNDHPAGERYKEILTQLFAANLAIIPKAYDRACEGHYPGGVLGRSWPDADQFWLGLLAAFPNPQVSFDHVIGRSDNGMPDRAAMRISLRGRHLGYGRFGTPTGADVYIMMMAHAEFGTWGLRREYVLFDDTAIWKQILLHKG
ncbi:MAG: nuclear transport factor 2 family protein [Alphaproteobacteria bacterium]|nr:nuclear transport factor 2 family protein [Alphaproteobacteria bacterium]